MFVCLICLDVFYDKISEKGHVKPSNIVDSHEKFLLGVATKGGIHVFLLVVVIGLFSCHWPLNTDCGSNCAHFNARRSVVKLFNAVSLCILCHVVSMFEV